MRQDTPSSTVQIQEPAFKEIKKRHGWLKGSCATGCGCIFLFVGAIYLTGRLVVGGGPSTAITYPNDFPTEIPQINPDKIIKITVVDASYKQRILWVATAIPRLLLSPVLSEMDPHARLTEEKDSLGRVNFKRTIDEDDYFRYIGIQPGARDTKTVVITWSGINNYPSLITDGIEKKLEKYDYAIKESTTDDKFTSSFTFSKDKISGSMRAIDLQPDQPGTEFVEMIVNYP